jgi:hypothetical protein
MPLNRVVRARAPGTGGPRIAPKRLCFGDHDGLALFALYGCLALCHVHGDVRICVGLIGGENVSVSDRDVGAGGNANENAIGRGYGGCGGAGYPTRALLVAMVAVRISWGMALLLC